MWREWGFLLLLLARVGSCDTPPFKVMAKGSPFAICLAMEMMSETFEVFVTRE